MIGYKKTMGKEKKEVKIVKYDNRLNMVPLSGFNKRELDFFYTICSEVCEKGTDLVELDVKDLTDLSHFSDSTHPDRVRDAINSLRKKVLGCMWQYMTPDNYDRLGVLFTTFDLSEDMQKFRVRVNKDFEFVFNKIAKCFTRFELEEYLSLKTKYSKALYRHLKQWRTVGKTPMYPVEDMIIMLDAPECEQKIFMRDIIKPSVKELNKVFENLQVESVRDPSKRGRPVKGYIFHFNEEEIQGQIYARTTEDWNKIVEASKKKKKTNSFKNFDQREYSDEYFEIFDKFSMGEKLSEEEKKILEQGGKRSSKI